MKKEQFKTNTGIAGLLLLFVIAFSSCTGDDTSVALDDPAGQPILSRVSLVDKDSTTSEGLRGNLYAIYGENLSTTSQITFSDTVAYFNPTLVTDTNILVAVPDSAPYFGGSNKLVVTTQGGAASLDFAVAQPAPDIDAFSPLAAGAGEIVTITGSVFEGLEAVRFGDTEAEIVSATSTEIQVRVPEGVVQSFIFVETAGGVTQSVEAFGFKYLIYGDELAQSFYDGSYNCTAAYDSMEQVKRGVASIKSDYTGGYGGFKIGYSGGSIPLDEYSAVKFSIYGGAGAMSVKVTINEMYDDGVIIDIVEGEWTNFTIPLSELNTPTGDFAEIVIQEFSGSAPSTIYIDDLGLI